ncbi:MAG: PEP-CTERM sorting domain-containing protein [Cyanobacteria bacterium J06632_22]
MNKISMNTGGIAAGVSVLSLGLGLLAASPAEASLIGDEITLDLEFSSNAVTEPDLVTIIQTPLGFGPAPQSTVVTEGSFLPGSENEPEFFAVGAAFGEGLSDPGDFDSESSALIFSEFNVEDDFIEGDLFTAWQLFDGDVTPFTWEYTFSDLDWTDFPDGRITGASLTFAEGFAEGAFFAFGGGRIETEFEFDFESLLSVDFTDDSVTLAIDVDPVFGSFFGSLFTASENFSLAEEGFSSIGAFGLAEGLFRIDLEVDHGEAPAAVPEPATVLGLLLTGGLGLKTLRRRQA